MAAVAVVVVKVLVVRVSPLKSSLRTLNTLFGHSHSLCGSGGGGSCVGGVDDSVVEMMVMMEVEVLAVVEVIVYWW